MSRVRAVVRPLRSQRGVALMMVLWIFMVLTVLVAEFSRGMRDEAVATQNMAEEVQARGVAMAGIGQALYRTLQTRQDNTEDETAEVDPDQWRPDGTWYDGEYGGGTFSVRMIDEDGKIPLNRVDEAMLRRVLTNVGVTGDEQEELTDAILDWRDADSMKRLHGAEADYYMSLPEPYMPKNGKFDAVEELLLVRGVTRDLFYGTGERPAAAKGGLKIDRDQQPPIALRDIFSVFNKTSNINVRYAPAPVLRAVMGGEEDDVQAVLDARGSDPGSALTLVQAKVGDQAIARRLVDRHAKTMAIDARAKMQGADIQARIGAVVDLADDNEGFVVVRWFDRLPAV